MTRRRAAADAIMKLAVGTEIYDEDRLRKSESMDMAIPGMRYRCLKGGNGGSATYHFKSPPTRRPNSRFLAQACEEKTFILKLKLIADAGLSRRCPMPGIHFPQPWSRRPRPRSRDYPSHHARAAIWGVVKIDETDFFAGRPAWTLYRARMRESGWATGYSGPCPNAELRSCI